VNEGGRASPYGPGAGELASLDTSDRRYVRWLLEQRARVRDRLSFPRERMLRMDQGTTVCLVMVNRDGSFAEPPEKVISSGHPDLDRAALTAIREAAPFSPIPAGLAPDASVLEITMPIRFHNPMVGN
jgi:protein TonB